MRFLVHIAVVPLFVFVSVLSAGVPPLSGGSAEVVHENHEVRDLSHAPSKIISSIIETSSPVEVLEATQHRLKIKDSLDHGQISTVDSYNADHMDSTVPKVPKMESSVSETEKNSTAVKDHTHPMTEKVSKESNGRNSGNYVVEPVYITDSSVKEHTLQSLPVVPIALNLKLSETLTQQINSIRAAISSTETNDIAPTEFHDSNGNVHNERISVDGKSTEPWLSKIVSTSASPKQRSRLTADKQSETKVNSIEDKWMDLEKKFRTYSDTVMKKALPKILRIHSQLNISSQCNGALLQMVRGLRNLKSWAIKMVDASGRFPSGSLAGTLTDLGDYDQCLEVAQPKRNKHSQIKGQYCTLELKPILPALHNSVTLNTKVLDFGNTSKESVLSDLSRSSALFHFMVMRIGVCVPSLCVADDIQELAAALLKKVPIQVVVRNCETKQDVHVTIPQFIVISAAVIVGILVLAGTAIDSYVSRNLSKSQDIGRVPQSLLAFSMTANLRQLFRTSRKSSALLSVNGIRCLSLMWIVLAHTYGFGHRQGLARLSHAKTYMDDVLFQIITNAWVSVDTFFLLGGLLVAFSNLKVMENNGGSINFISHVLHRVWRLTPPLAATLGVMFLLPLIGSGPLWADMVGQKVANCEKRWWQIFLPINTWIDFGSMCLLHTWYVAADIHFYCLAPLALIVLYRWPAIGFVLLFLLTAICSLVTGLLTIVNDLPPTVIFFSPDVELTKKTANLIYFRPYPHMGAYCVGLTLGYVLWKYRKFSLSKLCQGTGWVLSIVSCLAVLFATYSWSRGTAAEPAEGVTYAVLHRTVWAAGVAWILFVCATGHGGILNKFLSWQFFTPLSKLCYSVYLLHFPVLWVRVSWRRSLLNFHHYDIVTEFFGILMITLGLSIIFHLAFEAPFLKLEQIWFPERGRSTKIVKPLDDKATT